MALSEISQRRLSEAHPLMRQLFAAVAAETPILILDAQRGRAAQEQAFALGHSRAHFGQSAHNWSPALALDVTPDPLDWNDFAAFRQLSVIVKVKAVALGIPIVWGGDWPKLKDMPHYELDPWRAFTVHAVPYHG